MSYLLKLRRSPLWFQVTAFLFLATVLVGVAGGKYLRDTVKGYLITELVRQSEKTFSIFSAVSIEAVISQDIPLLETIVKQTTERAPDILLINIKSQSGTTLINWERPNQPSDMQNTLPLETDITLEGQVFGKMTWRLDLTPIMALADSHVFHVQLVLAAILVLLTLLIILGFHRVAIRPVGQINNRLVALAAGDLDSDLQLVAADELVRLSESVNDLVGASRLQRLKQKELREAQHSLKESNLKLAEYSRTLEDQVSARTKELASAVKEAEEARKLSEEANRAKSSFLANMSHELRTPLNAIIGYSEMLKEEAEAGDDFDPKAMIPDTVKITVAGKHLLGIINDILDLSKIEAGKMDIYLEAIDIKQLLQGVTTLIEPKLKERNNKLVIDCAEDIGSIKSDLTKLRQALLNLLANACKFTENGTITLKIKGETTYGMDFVVLSVRDTGIGMTREQLTKLFQPFSQADSSTTRKFGGTGLGLTITGHFCRMLQGDVWAESEFGKGSTFFIKLPRDGSLWDKTGVGHTASAVLPLPSTKPSAEQACVLVIDDDPNVHELFRRSLPNEKFHVISAGNGDQGISYAHQFNPDVITLDIKMPGADGLQTLKNLKQIPELADIPIVVVSIIDERNKVLELGAADFLLKPVSKERLIQLLSRYQKPNQTANRQQHV